MPSAPPTVINTPATNVEAFAAETGGRITTTRGEAPNVTIYYGAYAIMEVIEQGNDRLNIEDLSSGAGGVPVHGGFAWKKDRGSGYVEPEDPNYAQRSYIDSYINTLNSTATGQHAAWADPSTRSSTTTC